MEQLYKFNYRDYNIDGTNLKDGQFFLDVIGMWEKDFHDQYFPFYSTHLLANASSMIQIKSCFDLGSNEDCGMDGEYDLDTNLKLEDYSGRTTIYGIGSRLDEDEPLLLVRDDTMVVGMILLKYVPDRTKEKKKVLRFQLKPKKWESENNVKP